MRGVAHPKSGGCSQSDFEITLMRIILNSGLLRIIINKLMLMRMIINKLLIMLMRIILNSAQRRFYSGPPPVFLSTIPSIMLAIGMIFSRPARRF